MLTGISGLRIVVRLKKVGHSAVSLVLLIMLIVINAGILALFSLHCLVQASLFFWIEGGGVNGMQVGVVSSLGAPNGDLEAPCVG